MKKLYAIAGLSALVGILAPSFADASLNCSQNYSCDKTVYETLRYDKNYLFEDVFHANKGDKWLWEWCVNFTEPYDYNKGTNPTFDFTSELENNDWKVPSYGSMTVLTSSPAYKIKAVPPTRSYDNLSIKYTLEYSDDEAGRQTHAHTECIYYEISRCGDGTLDSAYETCDYNDTSKKNWGNGGCSTECKPVTVAAPVCNSDYNGKRVSTLVEGNYLCTEGSVTGFNYDAHKWTWKCNNAAGNSVDCSATEPYCGDGIKDAGETCDPKDSNKTGWGNGGCSASCEAITVDDPVCNSTYNGQRVDNLTSSSALCTKGSSTGFDYNTSTHKWTWRCENTLGKGVDCSATKPYCGDGILDSGEICDYNDTSKKNWGNGGCNTSCQAVTIADPVCSSSYNGKRIDNLVEGDYLCTEGSVTGFNYNTSTYTWTWRCENTLGKGVNCSATKPYCGDGIKDGGELCDYNDPSKTGWGSDGCDRSCQPIDINFNECDETFYDELRHKWEYTFDDKFNSRGADSWLRSFDVNFVEEKDFNKGANPTFDWTKELKDNNMKVGKDQTMKVIESSPKYQILDTPNKRSRNNLYIEYTIKYSTTENGSATKGHKECIYYEISRCGDGVLDTKYNEICDPADPNEVGWGNGGCDASCKPITIVDEPECNSDYNGKTVVDLVGGDYLCNKGSITGFSYNDATHTWTWRCENTEGKRVDCSANKPYDGTLIIDKSLVGSKEIKNTGDLITWNIIVTATGGDVTDFVVVDHLPSILGYSGYEITHNPGLTVSAPTVSGDDVEWDVKGTLRAGEYLEIRLTTYAKEMPRVDFTNVACVRENPNDPEKCDQVDIPVDGTLIIDKSLVGEREIKEVGDLITWNIKVTATGGNVTDFIVTDHLPEVLEYSSYSIINNPGLTVSEPVVSGKNIEWTVKGTLQEGKSLEISVVTSVTEMPKIDYENVACVRENPNDPEKCDKEDLPVMKVRIKKTFTDGTKVKTVGIGDTIAYRVSFGNSGTASASITSLKDFLPKNVSYVSSEIFINGQSVHSEVVSGSEVINTGTRVDGVYVDIYGGITLNPGDGGYIILTGKVLSDNQDSRTNFACIYVNDEKIDCDDARHDITTTLACTAPVIDTKSFTKAGGTTNVVCKTAPAGEKANSIELDCGNGTTYTGSNISELSGSCTYPANSSSSSKSYSVVCKVNGDTADNCKGTVTVAGGGNPPSGEDPHCKAPEIVNSGDYIKEVTCRTDNGGDYLIGITCYSGDTIHVSSGKVSAFTYTCKYDKAGTYNIQCYVPKYSSATEVTKDDTKPNQCGTGAKVEYLCKSVKVEPASGTSKTRKVTCDTNLPANEVESIAIYCNYENNKTNPVKTGSKVSSLTGECTYTSNGSYKVQCVVNGKVENSCAATAKKTSGGGGGGGGGGSSCSLDDSSRSSNPICNFANPHCFNVNEGNVSIEQGEILPFYFNIYRDKEQLKNYNYIVYKADKYPLGSISSYDLIKSDTSKCTPGDIALNSLKCEYTILDGKNNEVYKKVVPCLDDGKNLNKKGLISEWLAWQKKEYKDLQSISSNNYTFTTNVYTTDSSEWKLNGSKDLNYGEYKFQISQVTYLQCDEDGRWQSDTVDSVCQSNFMLTNSYTVQKTPSGNFTNTSTDKLKKYLYADGKSVMAGLLSSIAGTSEYAPNEAVKTAMGNFINKYGKLAVKVNLKNSFIQGVNVKKVPGKNIYFVDGDVTIKGGTNDITTPFTIVQTKGNTTISGDVGHNMMLLTNGNITFQGTCKADQTVKGIFYASGFLFRDGVLKNTKIDRSLWCTKGGLHVKGVLIGNGLENLMNNSRSNLNDWFKAHGDDSNSAVLAARRGYVMNGASVLIEYSPSIFTKSSMPPGAEDFTTALTVYKN